MKDHTPKELSLNLGDKVKWWDYTKHNFYGPIEVERVTKVSAFVTIPATDTSPKQVLRLLREWRGLQLVINGVSFLGFQPAHMRKVDLSFIKESQTDAINQ